MWSFLSIVKRIFSRPKKRVVFGGPDQELAISRSRWNRHYRAAIKAGFEKGSAEELARLLNLGGDFPRSAGGVQTKKQILSVGRLRAKAAAKKAKERGKRKN